MAPYERELEAARAAAAAAGRVTLEHFGGPLEVERKADASPVTIADRRAEGELRRILRAAFPDDGLLGEELGEVPGRSGRRWVLDPIDGTQSFIRGVPLYGVLVGLEEEGRGATLGVLALPALGRTYWAARGRGAFCGGRPIRVSAVSALERATVLSSEAKPDAFGVRYAGFERLVRAAACYRGWGDCYGYALVASGRADVMVDPVLCPWDAAAVAPIVEEAGGRFLTWEGEPTIRGGSGVAAPAALIDQVLDALRA